MTVSPIVNSAGAVQPTWLPETHAWVQPVGVAVVAGDSHPAGAAVAQALTDWLSAAGCPITPTPTADTGLVLTTARFEQPVGRDDALLLNIKRRFGLRHRPTLVTLVTIAERDYQHWLTHFAELAHHPAETPPASEFQYPGLGPDAVEVLVRQARRGGPEVALGRFLQGLTICFRVLALRLADNGQPLYATHFDLAGAHPTTDARDLPAFAADTAQRLLAASCTLEVNQHHYLDDDVPADLWASLAAPDAMTRVGQTFTKYGFFTDPVQVEKLLGFRGLSDAIAAHYSEGCYATWEPGIGQGGALISTASGSSRLVDKRTITREDQAALVGVRADGLGAIVRGVSGMPPVVPSVEAVEMRRICESVPTTTLTAPTGLQHTVPAIRSLLHGHVTVAGYDPRFVEGVRLPEVFQRHLVSCGTGALAAGTSAAFARAESLAAAADPRQVAFLIQPGHGIMLAEKWVADRAAFDLLKAYLADGKLEISMAVPQGDYHWEPTDRHGHPWLRLVSA